MYTFVITSVIPLLVSQMLMLYVISNNMKKADDLMLNQLAQISERTDLTVDVYTNLIYQIYSDDEIIASIIDAQDASAEARARACREICGKLQVLSMVLRTAAKPAISDFG